MKALAALSLLLVSASPPPVEPIAYKHIHVVRCGNSKGTAFRVGPDLLITAKHVSENGPCSIAGVPVETAFEDAEHDIAALRLRGYGKLNVSCDRPKRGRVYHGVGYAVGIFRMDSRLFATGFRDGGSNLPGLVGAYMFSGSVIPGMSGGPIFDSRGRVVGILNAVNAPANSVTGRALADTWVCK